MTDVAIDRRTQRSVGVRLARIGRRAFWYAVTISLSLMFMFPFFWTVSSSLKTPVELIDIPPKLLPGALRLENYVTAWTGVQFGRFFINSAIVTSTSLVGAVITSFLVAYGFARFRFPLRDFWFGVCLSTMILPVHVTIIPLFVLFRRLGWIDTFKPLIVPSFFGGGAFAIFLVRQFIMTLPIELDEAALIDGAGKIRILWKLILPNSGPALATVAIFAFMGHWNEFLGPLIFLNTTEKYTVPLGLYFLNSQGGEPGLPRDNLLMAGAVMATAPIIVLFFLAQKYFVQGIAMTGLKG
jgi:multiple sugar transport system permease protein